MYVYPPQTYVYIDKPRSKSILPASEREKLKQTGVSLQPHRKSANRFSE